MTTNHTSEEAKPTPETSCISNIIRVILVDDVHNIDYYWC
jgi:hypothetical protein